MVGKNEIREWVDDASFEDLNILYHYLEKILRRKLVTPDEVCAGCEIPIDSSDRNSIIAVFGPVGMKMKATFCGTDCLVSRLNSLASRQKTEEGLLK